MIHWRAPTRRSHSHDAKCECCASAVSRTRSANANSASEQGEFWLLLLRNAQLSHKWPRLAPVRPLGRPLAAFAAVVVVVAFVVVAAAAAANATLSCELLLVDAQRDRR
jgi:hypothetical protein